MKVTQVCIGRFHHFHLARQLERLKLLESIYCGYPKFKLKDETGIPKEKIKTYPWLHAPYMKRSSIGINNWKWLNKEWEWIDKQSIDKYVAKKINQATILIALSGNGLYTGRKVKDKGGIYICDRGSTHIIYQNEILKEEHKKWGIDFKGIDTRVLNKEESEYEESDLITVPSEFVKKTFISKGILESKIKKIPYGANLDRFKKVSEPEANSFVVLWVGGVSVRKGFIYALEAFQKFSHPNKEFIVVGEVTKDIKTILKNFNLDKVKFLGKIPNNELPQIYSKSHVFIIASLEEGLAMVQGEALACGCPVIATVNTGAEDLFKDGREGYIVPIRDSNIIAKRLEQLADEPLKRSEMSELALKHVKTLGGWNNYGEEFNKLILSL